VGHGDYTIIRSIKLFFFFSSRRRHTRSDRDWSSDVCSSDLERRAQTLLRGEDREATKVSTSAHDRESDLVSGPLEAGRRGAHLEIGRASCRERVEIAGGDASSKKKKKKADEDCSSGKEH